MFDDCIVDGDILFVLDRHQIVQIVIPIRLFVLSFVLSYCLWSELSHADWLIIYSRTWLVNIFGCLLSATWSGSTTILVTTETQNAEEEKQGEKQERNPPEPTETNVRTRALVRIVLVFFVPIAIARMQHVTERLIVHDLHLRLLQVRRAVCRDVVERDAVVCDSKHNLFTCFQSALNRV